MRFIRLLLLCMLGSAGFLRSQYKTDSLLENILRKDTSSLVQKLLLEADSFKVQIIYTVINRDERNHPRFTNYYFHVSKDLYFYPASTVKLPLAALSLEKLENIRQTGVNKFTRMEYDSSHSGQQKLLYDSSSESGYPSIAQFIRKAFLISDNDAYNRMYEFVGQQTINRRLHKMGFGDIRIVRQFMPLTEMENRYTNQIDFMNKSGKIFYTQPAAFDSDSFHFKPVVKIGRAYLNASDSLIPGPMDFTRHNRIPLEDLQLILQRILFPLSVPSSARFHLNNEDYRFLYRYLSQYPSETIYPKYDTAAFFDSYVKFFFQAGGRRIPDHIRVFNKVGWAYGFLTDISYIADFSNNSEFMISATVYANADGILNDNKYEYESVALPFMYRVGQDIYEYDLHRKRKHKPDLKLFRLHYEHRDPADKRPSILAVDN